MKQINLKCGFMCELPDNVMDNMELVDALAEGDENNPLVVSRICRIIYGDEVRKELYEHLRTGDGRVPVASVAEVVKETFELFGDDGKKS